MVGENRRKKIKYLKWGKGGTIKSIESELLF